MFVDGPPESGGSSTVANSTGSFAKAVTAIANTLAHQSRSNAEFVESLRNDWLIAREQ